MRQNLPILYRNVLDGMSDPYQRDVFLWATDKVGPDPYAYKAEAFARETSNLARDLNAMIALRQRVILRHGGRLMNEAQESDLAAFMMTRFANLRLGGNVKAAMPAPSEVPHV